MAASVAGVMRPLWLNFGALQLAIAFELMEKDDAGLREARLSPI
jgi:hypothetical protein